MNEMRTRKGKLILRGILSALLLLSYSAITQPASAAPTITYKSKWSGNSGALNSQWELQPGKVSWNSKNSSSNWLLALSETSGNLKFAKSMQTGFEIWFVNSDTYDGDSSQIKAPAVVVSNDAEGAGSTPNLVINGHLTLGFADSVDKNSSCSISTTKFFFCSIAANFSQYGGTISNYHGKGVDVYAYYKDKNSYSDSISLLFRIPASNFPAAELAKPNGNSFSAGSSATQGSATVTYDQKPGGQCRTVGQLAHYSSGNIQCSKVDGKLVWVIAGGAAATSNPLPTKAMPNCNPTQVNNMANIVGDIAGIQANIDFATAAQQSVRDRIVYMNNYGINYNKAEYQAKIDSYETTIRNYKNQIATLTMKFHSIDSVCRNTSISLDG
jgi:hypothetical protein